MDLVHVPLSGRPAAEGLCANITHEACNRLAVYLRVVELDTSLCAKLVAASGALVVFWHTYS